MTAAAAMVLAMWVAAVVMGTVEVVERLWRWCF